MKGWRVWVCRFSDLGVYPMYYNLVEEESDAEELQGSSGSDE